MSNSNKGIFSRIRGRANRLFARQRPGNSGGDVEKEGNNVDLNS